MFLAPRQFPFTQLLLEHRTMLLAEMRTIALERYEAWALSHAFEGRWTGFGLYQRSPDEVMQRYDTADSLECPQTRALLRRIPGLMVAGFSRLSPGSTIHAHQDSHPVPTVRCHLGLEVNPFARLRVGAETRAWPTEECLVFDGSTEHAATNEGREDRVVLLIDVERGRARDSLLPVDAPLEAP